MEIIMIDFDLPKWLEPSFIRYKKTMSAPEDIKLIILKGHLLIEEALEDVIGNIVAHKEIFDKARMSFYGKATLAQSMCWGQHENEMWKLIFGLNSLRNELAHSLESKIFEKNLCKYLDYHKSISKEDPDYGRICELSIKEQVHMAIVYALGFLRSYERDSQFFKKFINGFYKMISQDYKKGV